MTTTIKIDTDRVLGQVDSRIHGTLAEHIGRVIHGGILDPDHPTADDEGVRRDVLDAVRAWSPTVIRWPGGNFASGYHWRDGVGEAATRPGRHDLAWDAFDPNTFGTEEFLSFCRKVDAAPYLAVNASTGTIDEACGWVEYCNGTHPVPEVLQRRAGPHPEPHGVRLWGVGNENYGWWQHLHAPAPEYAALLREWGKLLYWSDADLEIVGVGAPMADWNWEVLTTAGRSMDHLSLHFYWHATDDDPYHSVLAGPIGSERAVEGAWGMCLEAQRMLGLRRPVRLAIDEWGVWNGSQDSMRSALANLADPMRHGLTPKIGIENDFEEFYDVKDALAVATWFHVMWRHPEKVSIATYAQMLNTLAPLHLSDAGLVRQATFHPLVLARTQSFGTALDVAVLTDRGVPAPISEPAAAGGGGGPSIGDMPCVDAAATTDGTRVHVSIVNRLREECDVTLDGVRGRARRWVLADGDPFAANTPTTPERVPLLVEDAVDVTGSLTLPPHSHVTLVFAS